LKKLLRYLHFKRKATNRHGIHSPFLYQFLDEVVYAKNIQKSSPPKKRRKEFLLYLKMFSYFKVDRIFLSQSDAFFNQLLKAYHSLNPNVVYKTYHSKEISSQQYNIYILNTPDNQIEISNAIQSSPNKNNTIVIIPQIRASKEQHALWESIKKEQFTRVSLEFYHFGLVFLRTENSIEHFKIRY